jgi:hypothetical protein
MSKLRTINLELDCFHIESVDGCGDELRVKLKAERKTRTGTPERYQLTLKVCRYGLREFLGGVKQMHIRDRERINSELARIEREINALRVQS